MRPLSTKQAFQKPVSIAEGDLARSTNDMYKEYGIGRVQKMRNGLAGAAIRIGCDAVR
jgi:hypothetical protein